MYHRLQPTHINQRFVDVVDKMLDARAAMYRAAGKPESVAYGQVYEGLLGQVRDMYRFGAACGCWPTGAKPGMMCVLVGDCSC